MTLWKRGGIPPKRKKRLLVHTAVSQGIAVFFCSTGFCFYLPKPLLSINSLQNGALAQKRVRFFVVRKKGFLLCRSLNWNERKAAKSIFFFLKLDKPFLFISNCTNALLSEWQTFIGRYP